MRKKLTVFLLAIVCCVALAFCVTACNKDDDYSGDNSQGSTTQAEYKQIVIAVSGNNFEAGNSYEIQICADGNIVSYDSNFVFTVTKNFNYATVTNGRLFINSEIDDNSEITLYATYKNLTSNTISLTVSNAKKVNEKKIAELESQLKTKQRELEDLQNQLYEADRNIERATDAYNDYYMYCINMGYMSSYGDWLTSNSSIRNQYNSLYSRMNEAMAEYNRIYRLIEDKQSEISSIQSEINKLR